MNNVKEILKELGWLGLLLITMGCVLPCVFCYLSFVQSEPPPKEEDWPSWAPDGQRIVVVVSNDEYGAIDTEEHIHIFDIQSRMFQPLIQK